MKESKDHLDIDLEFLDKKEPLRATPKPDATKTTSSAPTSISTNPKYNWKKILIIGGIILFFLWAIISGSSNDNSSSSSSNSTYTPTNTSTPNNNNFITGNGKTYSCSDSNASSADALRPDSSTAASLASESSQLDTRTSALKAQKAEIDSMYVDQTNQSSLDTYNAAVDDFNAKNDQLKVDIASWNQRNAAQNNQIDTYNNFLDANCTPQ